MLRSRREDYGHNLWRLRAAVVGRGVGIPRLREMGVATTSDEEAFCYGMGNSHTALFRAVSVCL